MVWSIHLTAPFGILGATALLLRGLQRFGKSVCRSTDCPKVVLAQSAEKARQECDPLVPPSLHDPVPLSGRSHERGTAIVGMRMSLGEPHAFKPVNDPGHGRALDLFGLRQFRYRPLPAEDENRECRELSWRNAEWLVRRSCPPHEMNRHRVEARRKIPDF